MKRTRSEDTATNDGSELIKINAGGKIYYTKLRTLTHTFPESMIACLFKRRDLIPCDEQCIYFLDVDANIFGALLNVLRRPSLVNVVPTGITKENWLQELDYWGIHTELEMEQEDVASSMIIEMPASLTTRITVFKEHAIHMKNKLKRCDLIVVDKILQWFGLDTVIGKNGNACLLHSFMPRNVAYLDLEHEEIHQGERPLQDPQYVDVSAYINNDMPKFKKFLEELIGFQYVIVELRVPKEDFSAFGKAYTKSKNSLLYISMQYDYTL